MSSTTKTPDSPADGALTPSLAPEHAELLVALDRMLTVGSYYPPGHEKYRQVAAAAHRAVVRAAGPQGIAAIEVNEPGLTMGPSFAAADSREAKRLHKLLMPLDVALLEIDTAASAEDLHAALLVLKKQQSELGSSRTYRTIEVTGLPASVRVTSRQLYVKMRHKLVGSGGTRPNIDAFDPNTIPDAMLVATPDGQHLEREFLAVVRGIMTGADPTKLQRLHETPIDKITQALGEWIPDAAIRAMKDIIDRLAETNSDPMVLESLVGHAKKALDLTGDADLVELAFQRLRVEREVKGESRPLLEGRPKPKGVKRTPVVYTMTRAQLGELVDEVTATVKPIADLDAQTNADCLGICYQILSTAPSAELTGHVMHLMETLVANEHYSQRDLDVARDALRSAFQQGWNDRTVELARTLLEPMRLLRPEKLGWLWLAVWEGLLDREQKEAAWPFLINDMLLGIRWDDDAGRLQLYSELTDLDTRDRLDLLARLETMPALRDKTAPGDIFDAPAPLLYPVYRLLLRSSLCEQFGPRLLTRLAIQDAHPLVSQLLSSLGHYDRGHVKLYQAMLDQGVGERVTTALADQAGRYLRGIVTRLDDSELALPWVPGAIAWLSRLRVGGAKEILRDIVEDRRWLFIPVWPGEAREAAREALEQLQGAQGVAKVRDEGTAKAENNPGDDDATPQQEP
ncbi:MAG: hypothetical protein IPH48_18350 [bacterium]|nr:hypothetical protein [bacterium]MBK9778319.1 hypothetical protein [bacterium]